MTMVGLPEKMQALVVLQDGRAQDAGSMRSFDDLSDLLELRDVPVPKPGPGQVLIKVRRSTVNPSDVAFVTGTYGQPRLAGVPAGFEGVGTVVASGGGVMARMMQGKNVAFYVTPDGSGAWADYAVTGATAVVPLKSGMRDEDAAAMLVNPVSAAAMLDRVDPGKAFVFSAAASQFGKLTAALAKAQHKRMIAVVRRDAPVQALTERGAVAVLNETDPDFANQLSTVLKREKPRHFFDALGGGPTATTIFDAMGQGARWVIYGGLAGTEATIRTPGAMIFQDKRVEAFWAVTWARQTPLLKRLKLIDEVQKLFLNGTWSTDVSAELPLERAIADLPAAMKQPDGKVQLRIGS